eukprot:6141615-Amphidinium_carterae.1
MSASCDEFQKGKQCMQLQFSSLINIDGLALPSRGCQGSIYEPQDICWYRNDFVLHSLLDFDPGARSASH